LQLIPHSTPLIQHTHTLDDQDLDLDLDLAQGHGGDEYISTSSQQEAKKK
jgi:hypothetical protein